jgi:hypothetical protein
VKLAVGNVPAGHNPEKLLTYYTFKMCDVRSTSYVEAPCVGIQIDRRLHVGYTCKMVVKEE